MFAFRVINDNGRPDGAYGISGAENKDDLLLEVEQFFDPDIVEIKKLSSVSTLVMFSSENEEDPESMSSVIDSGHLSENLTDQLESSAGWVRNWI